MFGVTVEWLVNVSGCTDRTARRWIVAQKLPTAVERLRRIMLEGQLHQVNPAWAGWKIHRISCNLVTPTGWEIEPREIHNMPITRQRVKALEAELKRLRRELKKAYTTDQKEARSACAHRAVQ